MQPLIRVEDLQKSVPAKIICDGVDFLVRPGEKVGLVAKNGMGKSTLLRMIAGEIDTDAGLIEIASHTKIGYLAQTDAFKDDSPVIDVLFSHTNEQGQLIKDYERAHARDDTTAMLDLARRIDEFDAWGYEAQVQGIIAKLSLQGLIDKTVGECSGGERKRIALATVLIDSPDVLILDEPTNHLDLEMIERVEEYLRTMKTTLLLVTHDRYLLERVCTRMFELHHGHIHAYPGNYKKFLALRQQRHDLESKHLHQMKQDVRRELERAGRAPQARQSKSVKRTKEIIAKEKEYKSIRAQQRNRAKLLEISMDEKRLGGKILTLSNVQKAFGDQPIIDDFSYTFRAGERMGIIGKNGAGKSTFINMLMETESVDGGMIERGETVTRGLFKQQKPAFDPSKRLIEIVQDVAEYMTIAGGQRVSASLLLEMFMFPRTQHRQKAHTLSGGEKQRLYLLTVLMSNPNFLILDEPTNDLDLETLGALEQFLSTYKGCLLVVSHDRYFMDTVVDQLIVFEGAGAISTFPGSYSDRKKHGQNQSSTVLYTKKVAAKKLREKATAKQGNTTNGSIKLTNRLREELKTLEEVLLVNEERKIDLYAQLERASTPADRTSVALELAEVEDTIMRSEERRLSIHESGQ